MTAPDDTPSPQGNATPTPEPSAPATGGLLFGAPRRSGPSLRQALLMVGGGVITAVTGCVGFLSTVNFNSAVTNPLSVIGGLGFVLGVILLLVGLFMLLLVTIRALFPGKKA